MLPAVCAFMLNEALSMAAVDGYIKVIFFNLDNSP